MNKFLSFLCFILCLQTMQAQLAAGSGEAFLKGMFWQCGFSANGSLGTQASPIAPACSGCSGYYYNSLSGGLGIVSDIGRNGWLVPGPSPLNNYAGDFTMALNPDEGWALQWGLNADTTTSYYYGYSGDSVGSGVSGMYSGPNIHGTFSAYSAGPNPVSVRWTSDTFSGFKIRQKAWFPDTCNGMVIEVVIRNISPVTKQNIYYQRAVNADCDYLWGSGLNTSNQIASQPDSTHCDAQVSSTLLSTLYMGSADSRARVSIGGTYINDASPEEAWTGIPSLLTAAGAGRVQDELIRICFKADNLPSGDSLVFKWVYAATGTSYYELLPYTRFQSCACGPIPFSQTICADDSILFGGRYYSHAGNYLDSFPSSYGCDSVVELQLQIRSPYLINRYDYICAGDTFFFRGFQHYLPATYYDTIPVIASCDTVYVIHLSSIVPLPIVNTISICYGDSAFIEGHFYHRDTLIAYDTIYSLSCPAFIYYTQLRVHPVYLTDRYDTICAGEVDVVGGIVYDTAGTYLLPYHTVNGCDSTVRLHLTILPRYSFFDSATICDGFTYNFRGHPLAVEGLYYDSVLSPAHCVDSFFSFYLRVNPRYELHLYDSLCFGDSIYFDFDFRSLAAVYVDTQHSLHACDSLIFLHLFVHNDFRSIQNDSICAGDSILFYSNYYHLSGNYTHFLSARSGCDSSVSLLLNVRTASQESDSFDLCNGDSLLLNGQYYFNSGIYYDTLFHIGESCPFKIQEYIITEHPLLQAEVIQEFDSLICLNDSAEFWQWIDCGTGLLLVADTQSVFHPDSSGTYAVIIQKWTCSDTSDCFYFEKITSSNLHESSMQSKDVMVFPNPVSDELHIRANSEMIEILLYDEQAKLCLKRSVNSNELKLSTASLSSGMYRLDIHFYNQVIHRLIAVNHDW